MKNHFACAVLVAAALTTNPTFAEEFPDGPRVEPGPLIELSVDQLDAAKVLLEAKIDDIAQLKESGTLHRVSMQNLNDKISLYIFEAETRISDPANIVLDRGTLTVTETKIGSTPPVYIYESSFVENVPQL